LDAELLGGGWSIAKSGAGEGEGGGVRASYHKEILGIALNFKDSVTPLVIWQAVGGNLGGVMRRRNCRRKSLESTIVVTVRLRDVVPLAAE
jgi:hypothetical protein